MCIRDSRQVIPDLGHDTLGRLLHKRIHQDVRLLQISRHLLIGSIAYKIHVPLQSGRQFFQLLLERTSSQDLHMDIVVSSFLQHIRRQHHGADIVAGSDGTCISHPELALRLLDFIHVILRPLIKYGELVAHVYRDLRDVLPPMLEGTGRILVGSTYNAGAEVVDLPGIPQERDVYKRQGPEIAVATTKAYSAQLIALYLLAMKFAHVRGKLDDAGLADMLEDMKSLPAQVEMLLNNKERIQRFANRYLAAKDIFFIGRGIDYAISMEGSLKLKEISYIHSEAYAAGELKHGTISLVEEGTLVASVLTQKELYKKMIRNMVEVRTRDAFVMAVTMEGNVEVEKTADYVVYIPETNKYFTNSLAIIPLQLFGYYVAVGKGCDVDKPRNLAKSCLLYTSRCV